MDSPSWGNACWAMLWAQGAKELEPLQPVPFTTSVFFLQETSRALWALWRASALHGGAGRHCLPCPRPAAPVLACRLGPGCLPSGVWPRVPVKLWRHCVCVMGYECLMGPVHWSSSVPEADVCGSFRC